jgi:RHS repeat-associated protein
MGSPYRTVGRLSISNFPSQVKRRENYLTHFTQPDRLTPYPNNPQSLNRYKSEFSGAARKYYTLAGQTVAMRDGNGLQYFLSDHLGSLLAVTDASGTLTNQQRYLPFGQVRDDVGSITQTDFGYTFQRNLPDTGLMDYDARFYLPALGRFSQPDTLVPDAGNPQNLNRYAYVRDNPLRYADPTGHWIDEGGGFATNKKKNGRLRIVSGRRVGNSDGDGIFKPSPPTGGGSGGNDKSQDCSWSGAFGGKGCDPQYYSAALGLDVPTLMMLSGLGISIFAPEVGVPIGLAGAAFEACAVTATPLCAAVKLASINAVFTLDQDGNFYVGPQISWGKSILPFGAVSFNAGIYPTEDGHVPTEREMEDSLKGFSLSAGTIATGGLSYSPNAKANKVAYSVDHESKGQD